MGATKNIDHGGMGLYILITPRGSKLWQLRYRMNGRERRASLGKYPVISLSEARKRAVETQRLINQGADPIDEKRALKSEKFTFAQLAREWIEKTPNKWSEGHTEKIRRRFERHILPWLGNRSITTITTPDILAVLRRIENVGANDLAHRCQ